jgi:hypothetical protein
MYRRILTAIVLIICSVFTGVSQPAWHRTDSITYRLYLGKNWKGVLAETKKSLQEGIDFYYLRVRAGIAAYEMKNYRTAAMHLSKAYAMNDSDEFVNYWYYYSMVMAGRTDEAGALASHFTADFLHRMQIRSTGPVNFVTAESQLSQNNDYQALTEQSIGRSDNLLGYRNLLRQQRYTGLGIDHRITGRLYAFHGVSHLQINRMQTFQSAANQFRLPYEGKTSQFQYYLKGRYLLNQGWSIHSSLTLLWGESLSHWMSFSNAGVPFLNSYRYDVGDIFITSSLSKEMNYIKPKISVSAGNINGYRQLQLGGQIVLYPFGNPDLYFLSDIALHDDSSAGSLKSVYNQRLGLKTGPFWWIADYTSGEIKNFGASDGYVVYNMPESIRNIYGLSAHIPFFKYRLALTARYQLLNKEGVIFDYSTTTEYNTRLYTFFENSYLISITWQL